MRTENLLLVSVVALAIVMMCGGSHDTFDRVGPHGA